MHVSAASLAALAALVVLLAEVRAESWTWPDQQSRGARTGPAPAPAKPVTRLADSGDGSRQRYEIVDPDSDDFTLPHPEDLNNNRPYARPPPQRPFPSSGGGDFQPSYRPPPPPPPRPPPPPVGPVGANRPPPGADRSDPTDVSKCKCVHAFNCEASALQFGSCDVGKRYCCSKEPRGLGPRPGGYGRPGGPGGYKPAILVGPGKVDQFSSAYDRDRFPGSSPYDRDRFPGSSPYDRDRLPGSSPYDRDRFPGSSPYDRDRYPVSSPYDRDRFPGSSPYDRLPGSSPGVLVGPRPTYYRPNPAAGFASRPGDYYSSYNGVRGPTSSPYRDYDNYNRGYGLRP